MKNTIFSLIALIFCVGVFAQGKNMSWNYQTQKWEIDSSKNINQDVEKIFIGIPLIFEGKILDSKQLIDTILDYSGHYSGKTYKVAIVQITKILKGDSSLKEGTIALLDPESRSTISYTDFGPVAIPIERHYVGPRTYIPNFGIYFCYPSKLTPGKKPYPDFFKSNDNSKVVTFSHNSTINMNSLEFRFGTLKKIVFSSKEEVYKFLEKYGNITIPKEEIKQDK